MFGFSKTFLDPDIEDWHLECWQWLLRNSGGMEAFAGRPLILSDATFYPSVSAEGHARALAIFEQTAAHAGMSDWPVELVPHDNGPEEMPLIGVVQSTGGVAGTFSHHENAGLITYDPARLDDPVSLIATFSHELGHYLNGGFAESPPGGEELVEPATDVTTAFLGFGIFGANACFRHEQWADNELQGWSTSTLGYISEDEWVFNLALFCALQGHDIATAKPFLKRYLYSQLKKATKHIEKRELISTILSGI